ncbi:pseudouridine synthase [Rhizobium sp. Root274]|uniref:pseudouridine synthase n=1 Tax=unclassified Rhizobium TaxID=2613769 RepID=UPI00071514A2|nr:MULTISPECIES: pseudouridine synthase [unclassified Rhizobium]KQW31541.1 pseudouridine synthase [Rhizobium sp. Root1240]KRD33081.1 pseudouridine synthase [Rhizobium sp. Root274]
MTFKDKSKRPAGKPAERGGKPLTRKPAAKTETKPARAARPEAPASDDTMKPERISKLLARAGVASRRDIERMIMEGRVAVNGKVLESPVLNATLADTIEVDGQPIRGIERTRLWLYHKPAGLVTTNSDPEGRPTVFENLPEDLPRVMSIGRLDINTEGLLLVTNDGGLARVLELPTTGWLRRYRVRAYGDVDQPALDALKEGIAVDGVLYGAIDATLDRKQGHNVWITMGLREGKNREIKNVLGALGLEVNRLIRVSYGPFQLGDLPEGQVQEVRGRMLRDQLGPRLIEEAKANFDAPVYSHGGVEVEDDEEASKKPARPAKAEWARDERSTGGKRPDKLDKNDRRERALERLDTSRSDSSKKFGDKKFGDKKFGDKKFADNKFDDKPKRAPAAAKNRTANVWMAPGARPLGEKAAAAAARRKPDNRPERPVDRFDDREGPRVIVSRAHDDEGEWIRADGPDKKPGGRDGGRGDKRGGFGDRPARRDGDDRAPRREGADRGPRREAESRGPRSDAPARGPRRDNADRPPRRDGDERGPRRDFSDRPARSGDDRPRDERPRGERPFGDKPRGAKPFGDKPRGPKTYGDKPAGRAYGDKPAARAYGDKPAARAYGDKPAGKSFGDKPAGKSFGKPGGKPAGKSFGGKPGGRPAGGPRSGGPGGFGGKPGGAGRGAPKGKR